MGLFVGPAKNLSESTALIDDDEKKNKQTKDQEAGEFSESRPAWRASPPPRLLFPFIFFQVFTRPSAPFD
jgi:hypothetical protein